MTDYLTRDDYLDALATAPGGVSALDAARVLFDADKPTPSERGEGSPSARQAGRRCYLVTSPPLLPHPGGWGADRRPSRQHPPALDVVYLLRFFLTPEAVMAGPARCPERSAGGAVIPAAVPPVQLLGDAVVRQEAS